MLCVGNWRFGRVQQLGLMPHAWVNEGAVVAVPIACLSNLEGAVIF